MTRAAAPPPPCTLLPQLRDVTINQGVGAYSPLVNGKETLVRFFLSMPSCAASGAAIQITGGTLVTSLAAQESIAAGSGLTYLGVFAENDVAQRLYARLGFVPIGGPAPDLLLRT